MKAALIRLGIPRLQAGTAQGAHCLEAQHSGGVPIPPTCLMNCGAIWRDWLGPASRSMQSSRHGLKPGTGPSSGPHAWLRCLAAPRCWCRDRRICWCRRSCRETFEIDGRGSLRPRLTGSPDESGVKRREKGLAKAAMHACGAPSSAGVALLPLQKETHWAMVPSQDEGAAGKRKTTHDRCTCPKASDRTVAPWLRPEKSRWMSRCGRRRLKHLYRGAANPVSAPWPCNSR